MLDLHTGQLVLFCLELSRSLIIQNLAKRKQQYLINKYITLEFIDKTEISHLTIKRDNLPYLQNWWSHLVDTGVVIKSRLQVESI